MQLVVEKLTEENLQKKMCVMIRDKFNQYELSSDLGKELQYDQEKVHLVKIFDMQQKLTNMSKIEFEKLAGTSDQSVKTCTMIMKGLKKTIEMANEVTSIEKVELQDSFKAFLQELE